MLQIQWLVAILVFTISLDSDAQRLCLNLFQPSYAKLQKYDQPQTLELTSEQEIFLKKRGLQSQTLRYLTSGSEGHIFVDQKLETVTKVFKSDWHFKGALKLEELFETMIVESGFQLPEKITVNEPGQYIKREFRDGLTVVQFTELFLKSNPELWNQAFKAHQKIIRKLRRKILSESSIRVVEMSSGGKNGYFFTLAFEILGLNRSYYLTLHEDNILITQNSEGEFEFTIIDMN
jgi:hypothetical protein